MRVGPVTRVGLRPLALRSSAISRKVPFTRTGFFGHLLPLCTAQQERSEPAHNDEQQSCCEGASVARNDNTALHPPAMAPPRSSAPFGMLRRTVMVCAAAAVALLCDCPRGGILVAAQLGTLPAYLPSPRQATNGLDARPVAGAMGIQITSPAAMAGTLRYSPTYDSPSIQNDLVGVRLTLPAKDQDISGCQPFTNANGDDGTSLAGTVLLMLGGACSASAQYANAQSVGASMWLNTFRSEGPDVFSSWAANSPDATTNQTAPYAIISYYDGIVLATWLRANPSVPLLVNIDGAGTIDANDMAVLQAVTKKVNDTVPGGFNGDCSEVDCGNTRALIDVLVNPSIDPCQNRAGAIWCINGRIVAFIFKSDAHLQNLPANTLDFDLLSQLPQLALLNIGTSLMYSIGQGLCAMQSMAVLAIYSQGLTSVPNCFHRMPLLSYVNIATNALTSFPTTLFNGSCPLLGVAKMSSNNFGVVPTGLINAVNSPNLSFLLLATAGVIATLPDFRGMAWLQQVVLNGNNLTANPLVPATTQSMYLDGLIMMAVVNLAGTGVTGTGLNLPLPTLTGCGNLTTITLTQNSFYGSVPASWASLQAVTSVLAGHNKIVSPVINLGGLQSLVTLDLSYNSLQSLVGASTDASPTFDRFLSLSVSPTVKQLSLAHNNLTGDFSSLLVAPAALVVADFSYNQITEFGSVLFDLAALAQLDMSNNEIVGGFGVATPPSSLYLLNMVNNPLFQQSPLPSWLTTDTSQQVKASGTAFVCASIVGSGTSLAVSLDPTFTDYQYCSCDSSYFGDSPDCIAIPDSAVVGQDTFLAVNSTTAESLGIWTPTSTSTIDPLLLDSANLVDFASASTLQLTDSVYGSSRLATGLNTRWQISSSSIVGTSSMRVLTAAIYLNLAYFNGTTNLLTVTQGDLTTTNQYTFSIRGDETTRLATATLAATTLASTPFGVGKTALFTLQVFDTSAVVQFQSRDTANQHFTIDYFFSDSCPSGYTINTAFVTGSTDACTLLPVCSAQQLGWSVSDCDVTKQERIVVYSFASQCRPTSSYTLPGDETTECAVAEAAHSTSVVLLVLVSLSIVALIVMSGMMMIHAGTQKQLLISRIMDEYIYTSILGLVLLLAVYFPSIGEVTTAKCQIRTHLIVCGFALTASSIAVSLYRRRQQLVLSLFNPNSPALQLKLRSLIAGVVAINLALVIIGQYVDNKGGDSVNRSYLSLTGGAVVPVQVCALPSLWLSAVLLIGNMAWVLPTLLLCVQVLWLATLNRDRLCAQLAAAKQRGGKKHLVRRHQTVAKIAMLTLTQLKSLLAALCGGLVLLVFLLLVSFAWTDTSPSQQSMAQGTVVLLLVAAFVLPMVAFSLWHRYGGGSRITDTAASGQELPLGTIATTGKSNRNTAQTGSDEYGNQSGGEDESSHEQSRSTSSSYNSSTTYSNGGSQYKQRDVWAQLTNSSNIGGGDPMGGLFDSNNTTGSKLDTVVSLMSDPVAILHLRKFAEASFQADSINFIVAVQQFVRQRLRPSGPGANSIGLLLHETDSLFARFVRQDGPDQINIADGQREMVRVALAALHTTAANLLKGRVELKPSEKDILGSATTTHTASPAEQLGHITIPRAGSDSSLPTASPVASTVEGPLSSPSGASPQAQPSPLPGSVSPNWLPLSDSPLPANSSRSAGVSGALPAWSPKRSSNTSSADQARVAPEGEWVEAMAASLGVDPAALSTPAPPSLCTAAVHLWRECSLEMILLISQNTLPLFQDSQQARLANSQFAYCDGFDNFNAAEQRAILARINIQFGRDALDQQPSDEKLFVQVVKP